LRVAGRKSFAENSHPVATAKRVLGRQDYCWTGSYRYWVWEREIEVKLLGDRSIPWKWRLFASKRGWSLELEVKNQRPEGKSIRIAGLAVLDEFIKTWKEGE